MAVDLTIGYTTGTPPTGTGDPVGVLAIKLYDFWSGATQTNIYPTKIDFPDDEQVKTLTQLEGPGIEQKPINDYREGRIIWKSIDLDLFDGGAGRMITELKKRIHSKCGNDYFIGAPSSAGAYQLPANDLYIRIKDLIIVHRDNSLNKKLADVTLVCQMLVHP